MARPKRPAAATAWWCRCLLVLVALGSSCRLTLATGRGALPANKQQVVAQASSYERDDHYNECRGEGAVCSRTSQCCAGACLRHTCWSHPHHRPPCRDVSEPCWDSDDCCGAFVCGQVGYHDHPVCYHRQPGPVDVCPVVTVTPPSAPVFVCENSTATDVAVAFNVSTDTNAPLDVPATITASDGRNCSLQPQGASTTVPSPSTVEYRCPQLNGTWSPPGSFELALTASAGPQGCESSTDSATATVTITDQPAVTVTPPSAPVFVCENSTAMDVAVAFTVATDDSAPLDVPATITATDGRVCSLQGATTVPSPSTVEYRCPQLNGMWSPPGSFTLTLTASAGPVGCASSTSSANATVTIRPSGCTPFEFTGGWQNFTVPAGVTSIRVDASGAQGGSAQPPTVGGKGARMSGVFPVASNDTLIVLVGGAGDTFGGNAGGGGGSFVVLANSSSPDVITSGPFNGTRVTLLVIAGGGGGAGSNAAAGGWPGQTGPFGTTSSGGGSTGGGIVKASGAGQGGDVSFSSYGSGGGGFLGNGTDDDCIGPGCSSKSFSTGGAAFVSGGAGGGIIADCAGGASDLTIGGFGGGGGGSCQGGAGGGGGYSGGDGGAVAGGAGSFNAGTDTDDTPGYRSGNGTVSICVVCV